MSNYPHTVSVSSEKGSVSLEGEHGKHLASVVMTNIYKIHILLYDLIDTNLSSLSTFLSNLRNAIKFCINILPQTIKITEQLNASFKNISDSIKTNLEKLENEFPNLYDSYGYINYLRIETGKIIYSNKDNKSELCLLIKAFRGSLSEFNRIESLIICIKSIIQEILKLKIELINSSNTTQKSQSNDCKIKCLCDNAERLFSAINDVEFYTCCLKYWICKFINSWNTNTLSTSHCVNYIEYFYLVFPLHLNSFYQLFSDVVTPKLSILISSVDQFTCLTSDIREFKSKLEGVSKFLNYNPAESLLQLIDSFDGNSYVGPVKTHIESLIGGIESLNVKNKYQEIIDNINSIVKTFNESLTNWFDNFKTKIDGHKKSLEQSIKNYIDKIKQNITGLCRCVEELRSTISKAVENLEKNQGKLNDFKYDKKEDLIKPQTQFTSSDGTNFETIFKTHEKYKQCLESCPEITAKLKELKGKLEEIKKCSEELTKKLETLSSEVPDTSKLDPVSDSLKKFKTSLDNLSVHYDCFKKLQEINGYITKMKEELEKVQDKVKDEAKDYITKLENVDITESGVREKIDQIEKKAELIIKRLEIAKSAIGFHELLKTQLTELQKVNKENGDNFNSYDFTDYLKNSSEIQTKVFCFDSKIKSELTSTKEAIKKVEEQIKTLKEQCPEIQEQAGKVDELISAELDKIQQDYTQEIQNITKFIVKSLEVIKIIKYILLQLENNKNQSPKISEIKSKIEGISGLNDATPTLTQAVQELNKFVELQENTKSLIETFSGSTKLSTLIQYSDKLKESITKTSGLIGLINYYTGYLKTLKNVDSLITCIKSSHKSKFEKIKPIFDNFKTYVEVITSKLETINSNLCELKCRIEFCCSGYNNDSWTVNKDDLYKMKDYMKILKTYLPSIKSNFIHIKMIRNQIKQESSYIDQKKSELKNLEKVIGHYVKCLECSERMKLIVNYLKSIKDRIKEILTIKYLITEHSNMNKIDKIDCRLKGVEKSINDLECAIEAVVGNAIRCSLKSLTTHLTNFNSSDRNRLVENDQLIINYSISNVTNYKVIINGSLDFWKMADEATKLVKFIRFCPCGVYFESRNKPQRPSIFPESLYSIKTTDINPVSELARNTMADNLGNHLCLCLVIKYHLRPAMLKCILYLRNEDLGTLSTLSRKHNQYNPIVRLNSDLWKIYCLTLSIIYKITLWIKHKHKFVWIEDFYPSQTKCFCTYYQDPDYHLILSIILVISSLIENIWRADNRGIVRAIQSLSSLLSEYQSIHVYTNYYSKSPYKILPIIINGLKHEKSDKGTLSHSFQVANQGNETLVKSTLKGTTTITEKKNESTTTTTYAITGSSKYILKNSIKGMLVSVSTMIIGTHFSKESFELIYNKFSDLLFYTQTQSILTRSKIKTFRYPRIRIPIKCLEKICQQSRQECNCTVTNKESKICPIAKIRMSGISISLKRIEVSISIASKDILIDFLMGLISTSEDFFWNLCVGFGEVYTAMAKNSYITHFNTYTDQKNIANSFPSVTVGYGYESVYDHEQSSNSGYRGINGIREGYTKSGSGRITKKNKMKEKERVNVYTLEYLHTRLKTGNNIKNYP